MWVEFVVGSLQIEFNLETVDEEPVLVYVSLPSETKRFFLRMYVVCDSSCFRSSILRFLVSCYVVPLIKTKPSKFPFSSDCYRKERKEIIIMTL